MVELRCAFENKDVTFDLNSSGGKYPLIGALLGTSACIAFKHRIAEVLKSNKPPSDLWKTCLDDKYTEWEEYSKKITEKKKSLDYYPDVDCFMKQKKEWEDGLGSFQGDRTFYEKHVREMNPGICFNFKKSVDHVYRHCFFYAISTGGAELESSAVSYKIKWAILKSIRYSLDYIRQRLAEESDSGLTDIFEMLCKLDSFGYEAESNMGKHVSYPKGYDGLLEVQKKLIDSEIIKLERQDGMVEISIFQESGYELKTLLESLCYYMKGISVVDGEIVFKSENWDEEVAVNTYGQPVHRLDKSYSKVVWEGSQNLMNFSKKQVTNFRLVRHPGKIDLDGLRRSYFDYADVLKRIEANVANNVSTVVHGDAGTGKTAACFISFISQYKKCFKDPDSVRTPVALHPEKLIGQFDREHNRSLKLYECSDVLDVNYDVLSRSSCVYID